MKLLLDSHALLWFAQGRNLSPRTRAWVESAESAVFVSVASAWELWVKEAKGRLRLGRTVSEIVALYDFQRLPVTWAHAEMAIGLPHHHGDPFDRMLVAQAQAEGLSIVSDDADIARYRVHVVPASR